MKLRPGYSALASQLALAQPSSTEMSQYTPTNTAPSLCLNLTLERFSDSPNSTERVPISTNIVSAPSRRLCSCMIETVGCYLDQDANATVASEIVTQFCNENAKWCAGVDMNSTEGIYGSFSGCKSSEQQSWAFNQYYLAHDKNSSSCSSIGGTTKQPIPPTSQTTDCRILLDQAGPLGTGTVTFTPTLEANVTANHTNGSTGRSRESIKIGVSIGAAVFLIILSAITILFIRRRKKAKATKATKAAKAESAQDSSFQKPELDGNSAANKKDDMPQIDGTGITELDATSGADDINKDTLHELPGSEINPIELDSTHAVNPRVDMIVVQKSND